MVTEAAISRTTIFRTREALGELMARRLDDVRLAVLMLDAIARTGRTTAGGARDHLRRGVVPLGPWEGS